MQRNARGVPRTTDEHVRILREEGYDFRVGRHHPYGKVENVLFPVAFWERGVAMEICRTFADVHVMYEGVLQKIKYSWPPGRFIQDLTDLYTEFLEAEKVEMRKESDELGPASARAVEKIQLLLLNYTMELDRERRASVGVL